MATGTGEEAQSRALGRRALGFSTVIAGLLGGFFTGASVTAQDGTDDVGSAAESAIADGAATIANIPLAALGGATLVIGLLVLATWAIMTSKRLTGSSLFNRLFVVVATTSAFFSGVSSAIGFSLITSQETEDFFRNAILPPAFGMFVFFLAVAIWVGGAELVRHRDWFRGIGKGPAGDAVFFVERAIKLFILIPILATILFFVSTWTTVVGIGGVDAVRYTYDYEINRLQSECSGITAHRQRDFLFLADLNLSVNDVSRAARNEIERGTQTGLSGRGKVSDYFEGVAEWLQSMEDSVSALIEGEDPSGFSPYDAGICEEVTERLKTHLAANAFDNYDLWAREFETDFNGFTAVLNRWRGDLRIERLLEQQLATFQRANPKPVSLNERSERAIDAYSDQVETALKSLIRRQKLAKPPEPIPSAEEISPARGMSILYELFREEPVEVVEEERKSRTQSVVYNEERIATLSTITPRDAVLKNANIFSDIWALAIAWDYASYILMLAYLFFPSAERAPGNKD
ncbi:MAG: hypothetical protein AAFY84_07655 [Pseudomonadota bacterium]